MISSAIFAQTMIILTTTAVVSGEATDETTTTATTEDKPPPPGDEEELDWGSFYDPKEIFCGKYDCYKILGFDYTTFDSNRPSLKNITQSYRKLSRRYHPDKNKEKGSKELFVKIAKAYETLTDVSKRREYDRYRDRPDEYFAKYGSSVMFTYAPKTDTTVILFMLFVLASLFVHFAQRQRWQTIANHMIKAAAEDLSTREGGSTESQEIRRKALDLLAEQEATAANGADASKNTTNGNGISNRMAKKNARLNKQEKKKESMDELRKVVTTLVYEIDDFGAGFHKPTWRDALILKLIRFPLVLVKALGWRSKFYVRRLLKKPHSPDEIQIMTEMAVGAVAWESVSDEEREHMVTLKLWETENLEEWREDQKAKLLSAGDQKKYARMKKKQGKQA